MRKKARLARRPTTLRDVATEAGVGIATASRVLTAQGYASPEVRARVATAARKLHYAPRRAAPLLAFGEGRWEMSHCPAISAVRHDYTALAEALTKLLIARIEVRPEPDLARFPTRLHERESLGPAPVPSGRGARRRDAAL